MFKLSRKSLLLRFITGWGENMKDMELPDYLDEYIAQCEVDLDRVIDPVDFAREYASIFEYTARYNEMYQLALDYANGWIRGGGR